MAQFFLFHLTFQVDHRKFTVITQIFFHVHKCETVCTDDMKTTYWVSYRSGWNKMLSSPSYSVLLIVTWLRTDDQWCKDCCLDTQLLRSGFVLFFSLFLILRDCILAKHRRAELRSACGGTTVLHEQVWLYVCLTPLTVHKFISMFERSIRAKAWCLMPTSPWQKGSLEDTQKLIIPEKHNCRAAFLPSCIDQSNQFYCSLLCVQKE